MKRPHVLMALASSRLVRGTAAASYGQVIQVATQLVAIPIFTRAWGLEVYGAWMILFTIPQLLAMGDFGLAAAGGNAMTAAVARGEFQSAARIHGSLRFATLAVALAILGLAGPVLWLLPDGALDSLERYTSGHAAATGIALLCYGLLGLVNTVSLAAFRAADAFAFSNLFLHTMLACEAAIAVGTVLAGLGPREVAIAYALTRLVGSAVLMLALRPRASWLRGSRWVPHGDTLRPLIAPSVAALSLPAAYAVMLQGSVLAIGAAAGPSAVPAFTITRTLSRSVLQFVAAFNLASMPQYTMAEARGDRRRRDELVGLNILVFVAALLPLSLMLTAIGPPFVAWWTGGVVNPSTELVTLLVAAMVLNGLWVPLANLIFATNNHAAYSYLFLAVALASVGIGYLLVLSVAAAGMAAALLAGEAIMVAWVLRLAIRLEVLRPAALWILAKDQIARLGRPG